MQNKLFFINTIMQCRAGQVSHNIHGEVDRQDEAQRSTGMGWQEMWHRLALVIPQL